MSISNNEIDILLFSQIKNEKIKKIILKKCLQNSRTVKLLWLLIIKV